MKKILFLLIATIITHVAYSQTKTMTCPTCMGKGVFVCPSCLGKGLIYDSYFGYSACYNCGGAGSFKCGLCHGKGKVVLPDYNPNINYNNTNSNSSTMTSTTPKKCSRCNATGNCKTCGGTGKVYDYGTLTIITHGKYERRCGVCNGSGKCGVCDGKGHF